MSAASPTDLELLVLNAYMEAAGEPDDGVAAIVEVTLNRARLAYRSDGTVRRTVAWPSQFSWTGFDMVAGHYTRVASSPEEIAARIERLLLSAKSQGTSWGRVADIAARVMARTYQGALYGRLTGDTVLYYNPRIVAGPDWAIAANKVCTIGHHDFFRDPPRSGAIMSGRWASFALAPNSPADRRSSMTSISGGSKTSIDI